MKKKKPKTYEVTGIISFGYCFSYEVEANSQKEALEIAEGLVGEDKAYPSHATYDTHIIDKPVEIK
jgi:hypothetical protein